MPEDEDVRKLYMRNFTTSGWVSGYHLYPDSDEC